MASALLSTLDDKGPVSKSWVITSELRSLNDFPDEILLKILSHFGPEDLCLIIAKVCERWNALAKDVTLWKTLCYECDRFSDFSRVSQVLSEAPALHTLVIHNRKDAALLLGYLFDSRVDLKQLILRCCSLGEDSTGLLAYIAAFYTDLEVLALEGCHPLTFAGYALIPCLKKLSELNLSHCKELSGSTVCFIAEHCKHLKKYSLDGVTQIFDDDIIHVIKKLGRQLTTLTLDGEDLTDVAFSYLNNCTRLQELEVSFCEEMTDKGLLEGIGSLQELRSLRLKRGYNLTAQALSTFLHRPAMTSIVCLNLSECTGLDDDGLKGIAERCLHLKTLALCWCWEITDSGISMVICHCSQLRMLDLLGVVRITGKGYFGLVPSHLPHLRLLNLEQCSNVCDESLEELVTAVPELVVINYYGDRVVALKSKQRSRSDSKEADVEWSCSDEEDYVGRVAGILSNESAEPQTEGEVLSENGDV